MPNPQPPATHIAKFAEGARRPTSTACGSPLPDDAVRLARPPTCPTCLRFYLRMLADAQLATARERDTLAELDAQVSAGEDHPNG